MGGTRGWAEATVLSTDRLAASLRSSCVWQGISWPPQVQGLGVETWGPYSSWGRGTGGVHMGPAGSPHESSSLALGTNGWLQSRLEWSLASSQDSQSQDGSSLWLWASTVPAESCGVLQGRAGSQAQPARSLPPGSPSRRQRCLSSWFCAR